MVQDRQTTGRGQTEDSERLQYIRVFPSLVVDLVLEATLLVVALIRFDISDLGLVEQLMMEAEDLLVLAVRGL
jgi:hypothetical protein